MYQYLQALGGRTIKRVPPALYDDVISHKYRAWGACVYHRSAQEGDEPCE